MKMYRIYENHYGAKCWIVNTDAEGNIEICYKRTCHHATYTKDAFEKNFTYIGSQEGHPLTYGIICR